MQISVTLLPLGPKYSYRHPVLKLSSSFTVKDQATKQQLKSWFCIFLIYVLHYMHCLVILWHLLEIAED
jgi:hypothetical protein